MFFVYAEYSYGTNWDTDSVCLGNHFELIEVDNEDGMRDYLWELQCEEANNHYFNEEEEWGDFVEDNSSSYKYFPYDPTKEGHVELSDYEDKRPEYAELLIKRARDKKEIRKIFLLKELTRITLEQNKLVDLYVKYEKELLSE